MLLLNKTTVEYTAEDEITVSRLIGGKIYMIKSYVKTVKSFFLLMKAYEHYTNNEFKAEAVCLTGEED